MSNKTLLWIITAFYMGAFASSCAMTLDEDFFDLSAYSPSEQKKLLAPPELSLNYQVVYIGASALRKQLEKVYGKEFPHNTVFCQVYWLLPLIRIGLIEQAYSIPEFMPYEMIKDKKEDDVLDVTLNGRQYVVTCRQKRKSSYRSDLLFHDLLKEHVDRFSSRAEFIFDGKDSLIDNEVITTYKDGKGFGHGKNKSPFVQTN